MAYEEARKLRLQENQKRFQDLGITQISKALNQISTKTPQQRIPRPIDKSLSVAAEPRRSSRVRTHIASYREDVVEIDHSFGLRKPRRSSSWANYIARPLHECKFASYEEKVGALKAAEEFQSRLGSPHPSFVKSMVRSHVYSCFWLGLPSRFCSDHLTEKTVEMVLEDEKGEEYEAVYIGKRVGLSGGWKRFALDHKLDDGDALLFHLVEPLRFKVYIFRGDENAKLTSAGKRQREEDKNVEESGDEGATKRSSARLLRKKRRA